ncbi:unnamed protein product [Spirodela intermedia]|uniref:BHLH domain-containing protein n=1 Tax=Spirodela intermedia TaxID=51605 RepID=A0A7I8KGE0_SPIIN|nr:unnamed protein product [Spirodela intermedia]
MRLLLRETLRRLCAEIGWSYAVFWHTIRCGNSRHLVWLEGHYEPARASTVPDIVKEWDAFQTTGDGADPLAELGCLPEDKIGDLVEKTMRSQVHVLGDGVVGRAAITGCHQWIIRGGEGCESEVLGEMNHQFSAGIMTTAVIPVLPHGVVQLGSIQTIMENLAFVEHVRRYFLQVGRPPRNLLPDGDEKPLDHKNRESAHALPISLDRFGAARSNVPRDPVFNNRLASMGPFSKFCYKSGQSLHGNMQLKDKPAMAMVGGSVRDRDNPPERPAILSNEDMKFQQVELGESGFGRQPQQSLIGSSLRSSSLSYAGKQLFPHISEQRFPHSSAASGGTRSVQVEAVSSSLQDSTSMLTVEEASANGHFLGMIDLLPCGDMGTDAAGTQSTSPYELAAAHMLTSRNISGGRLPPAEIVSQGPMDRNSKILPAVSMLNMGSNSSSQSLESPCIDPKSRSLSSGLPAYHVQECWASGSDPTAETRGARDPVLAAGSSSCASNVEQKDKDGQRLVQVGIPCSSADDLFDVLGVDFKARHCYGGLDAPSSIAQLDVDSVLDALHDGISSCSGIFSDTAGPDQLLDAVVSKITAVAKQGSEEEFCCRSTVTRANNSLIDVSSGDCGPPSFQQRMPGDRFNPPPPVLKSEVPSSCPKSVGSAERTGDCSQTAAAYKSHISLWVDDGQNTKVDGIPLAQCTRMDEAGKSTRKRPRPGDSPRPRPKDRQMIQDRVKELREIVPNGAKCSIDALLERTIKHMLFLQSVTKHADMLRETGEPKIISKEGGLLLKDNFEGGATWAFEVGARSPVCPIIVEDLHPPRRLLVEMLCEERGFFLEIADLIRGLGLTILKGVMEARKDKVWARFAVEANRDVTRMDIFMSLVRLLEPTAGSSSPTQGLDNANVPCNAICPSSIPATGMADRLQ